MGRSRVNRYNGIAKRNEIRQIAYMTLLEETLGMRKRKPVCRLLGFQLTPQRFRNRPVVVVHVARITRFNEAYERT
jgi:hypothetical protein